RGAPGSRRTDVPTASAGYRFLKRTADGVFVSSKKFKAMSEDLMTRWLRVCLFGLVVASAVTAEAQFRLNFPKLIAPNELSTTGFALVNTGSSSASVTFICYGTNGGVVTQALHTIPAKGQLPLLGSEAMPNTSSACWVQILSSSSEIQGFELVGDF